MIKKFLSLCSKPALFLLTHAALLYIVTNVNTTCCGPGYQPALPKNADSLRHYKND